MRLLYLADIRFPLERANGIQTMETCHALARRGVRVSLVVRPDTTEPPRDPFAYYGLPPIAGFDVDTIATPAHPASVRRAMYLIGACLRTIRGGWDVVLTRDLGVAARIARIPRAKRPPLVYESHGFAPAVQGEMADMLSNGREVSARKQSRLLAREAIVWRRAEGYITITRALADELVARFGARGHLAVIPDGVRAVTGCSVRPRSAPPTVGYAGHLYPWKGVDVLLDALSRLPHVRGLIIGGHAGESDLERCRAVAHDKGLDDRVTFTGMVPPPAVADHLARADILVLPNTPLRISRAYTSPLKLFEYMAARRPIVASDLPAVREVLDEECAVLVTPGDGAAMAEAIQRLIEDPRLAQRIADAAARRAEEYTWDARAARLEAALRQVVEDRRR